MRLATNFPLEISNVLHSLICSLNYLVFFCIPYNRLDYIICMNIDVPDYCELQSILRRFRRFHLKCA